MFFEKKKPPAPSVDDEDRFIEWLLRYSEDLAVLRKPYKNNLDKFVEVNLKSVKKELQDHKLDSARSLIDRGGEIAQFYDENFREAVDSNGGILNCPTKFQAAAVMLIIKISIMLYLAKHKYGAPIPEELLGMTRIQ
jgi:hypothetical protein